MTDLTTQYPFLREVKTYKQAEAQIELNMILGEKSIYARFELYNGLGYMEEINNMKELLDCFSKGMKVFKVQEEDGIYQVNKGLKSKRSILLAKDILIY